jgi:hypothetical protein
MDSKDAKEQTQTPTEKKQQTQNEALRVLVAAVVKAQKNGVYTLDEASAIHSAVQIFSETKIKK